MPPEKILFAKRLLRITTVPQSMVILLEGQLSFLKKNGFEILAVCAGGPETRKLEEMRIRYRALRITRRVTPLRDILTLFQLVHIIREFRPHIVHTHTPKAGVIGMMAAWLGNVPVRMHTVAGLPLMERKGALRKLLIFVERITYRFATGVYPNSTKQCAFIKDKIYDNQEKVRVLGHGSSNGINTSFFSKSARLSDQADIIRLEYHIPKGAIVFCFVGRLVREKGLFELLAAFQKLRKETLQEPYLMLVGPKDDPPDYAMESTIQVLADDTNIILTGFREDIRPYLLASDVFVFPSYREGFPNAVMQACALELPSIVSDINGCNEIIQHEVNGLIVPPKDAESLKREMLRLVNDPALRKDLSAKARRLVGEKYEQQYFWNELLNEYQRQLLVHGDH